MKTITVLIENTYECGRSSSARHDVPAPEGHDLEPWWEDVVHDLTGDGHPCGAREHGYYEATIVAAPALLVDLIDQTWVWEG